MKRFHIILVLFLVFSVISLPQELHDIKKGVLTLDQNWQLRRVSTSESYKAIVPGCVHTDLLKAGKIPDPFYRLNEHELQWIDKEDWEYSCKFNLNASTLQFENFDLVCEGLDTYADVYLNGQILVTADNMFRTWRMNCKALLKTGENTLRIYFRSPVKTDLPKLEKLGYQLPASNDLSEIGQLGDKKISVFARKAPYHYGWDWGPRFVTSGIWRPIYLEMWNSLRIESVQIVTQSLTKQLAALHLIADVAATKRNEAQISVSVNGSVVSLRSVQLEPGIQRVTSSFEIVNPELWWPNSLGAQSLYNISCKITAEEQTSEKNIQYGLRDIQVIQKPDSVGRSFYFQVNGFPVFMKGANYIPADIFLPRVSTADYENIIKSAADANMNMLRVWGGGIYENDIFYDLCDRYGILVWQDCMFACSMYPGDHEFLENVRHEIIDNVKRLRNHPCLALWAGNNEMEDAWNYWGWQKDFTEKQKKDIYKAYSELFLNIIPDVIRQYDGTRFYWPSCPSSDFGRPSKSESGDIHDWEVWHGKKPFENYQIKKGRFFSEYGFQSFPDFYTIKTYSKEQDWDIESDVMKSHQRSGIGNLRIRDYLRMYYSDPKDFQNFLYVSQVLQAFGIKQAIEAHRRAKPFTMGSLYWQIDDCWPVASWSSMDYNKRWKAVHYTVAKAFQQVLCSPLLRNDSVIVSVVNDNLTPINGTLSIKVCDFYNKLVFFDSIKVELAPLENKIVWKNLKENLLSSYDSKKIYSYISLSVNGNVISDNVLYFEYPKDLSLVKPDITTSITETKAGWLFKLQSPVLAKDVFIDLQAECFITDNYFDLLPGTEKEVIIKTKLSKAEIMKAITIHSLVDTY